MPEKDEESIKLNEIVTETAEANNEDDKKKKPHKGRASISGMLSDNEKD